MIALIGIVLLMGIVKKNAIMMIDFALEAERAARHVAGATSIVQAALLRFRPIMMTTLAALFGALPLALESGTGSELRNPLGITIIGGLLLQPVAHALHHAGDLPRTSERLRDARAGAEPAAPAITAAQRAPEPRHELLLPVHPPADRHHAAGHRAVSRWRGRLSLPAGRQPAERSNFRPSSVIAKPPGRRSQHHGGDGRGAARAPARRDCRRHRNDLGQSRSASSRITIQFDLNRSIDGAARDVQAALNAALSDLPERPADAARRSARPIRRRRRS